MHTTVLHPISSHPRHAFGVCSYCESLLSKRNGDVNGPHCLVELYCAECQTIHAETPDIDDLQKLAGLLATRKKLLPGNLGGISEPLRRILARR
jgi:hypothetical protein